MKKTILLISAVTVIAFSCADKKQDYKCTCTGYSGGVEITAQSVMINDTKEGAMKQCEDGTSGNTTDGVVCKIQ